MLGEGGEVLERWLRQPEGAEGLASALRMAAETFCDRAGFEGHDYLFVEGPSGRAYLACDGRGRAWVLWGSRRLQPGLVRMLLQDVVGAERP